MCPDSKAAHPILKNVLKEYTPSQLSLRLHFFPLPYHTNAFLVAKSAFVLHAIQKSTLHLWVETMYANQNAFSNTATNTTSSASIQASLASLALMTFPSISTTDYNTMWTEMEMGTRIAWKYAASRGVTGTPVFFVNEVIVSNADSTWTVQDWKGVLDPLMHTNYDIHEKTNEMHKKIVEEVLKNKTSFPIARRRRPIFTLNEQEANKQRCQNQEKKQDTLWACEFEDNTSMCCTYAEVCIVHKGCLELSYPKN